MLYVYPAETTAENWLHESLVAMLTSVHIAIAAGETIPTWPEIIPGAYRENLAGRHGLRDRLVAYATSYGQLSEASREIIARALLEQNQIALLLSCQGTCQALDDLPEEVRPVVRRLFGFAFEILADLGIRDRQ